MGDQKELFGIKIDSVCMEQAVDRVQEWVESSDTPIAGECKYVVTPNVDHTVLLSENESLQAAYTDASLILADGHPIVWASRLLRRPLPERVPVPNWYRGFSHGTTTTKSRCAFFFWEPPKVLVLVLRNG